MVNMVEKAMDNKGITIEQFKAVYEAAEIVSSIIIKTGNVLHEVLSSNSVQFVIGNPFESMDEEVEC